MVQELKKWLDEQCEKEDFDSSVLPSEYTCPKCSKNIEIADWSSFLTIIEHLESHIKNLQYQINSWEEANAQYGFLG